MKIRSLCVLMLLAVPMFAADKDKPYLLLYRVTHISDSSTVDPCAIWGNCRTETVVEWFDTQDAAVKRLNENETVVSHNLSRGTAIETRRKININDFVGLYKVNPVKVSLEKSGEEEVETYQPVKVKRDKFEWRIVK